MRKTWYQHILMVLWLLGGLPLNVVAQTDTVKVERSDAEWAQALTDSLTLLLNDELFTTSQLGLCVYDLTPIPLCLFTMPANGCALPRPRKSSLPSPPCRSWGATTDSLLVCTSVVRCVATRFMAMYM